MTELIEGVNIGKLPDPFPFLTKKDSNILKIKSDDDLSSLNEDYLRLLDEVIKTDDSFREVKEGEIVTGKIQSISKKEIVIDIGYKDFLYVENKLSDLKIIKDFNIDDDISVMVTEISDDPFYIKGSVTDIIRLKVSEKLKEHYYNDGFFYAVVKEMKPAGFMLDIEMDDIVVDAFMPTTLAGINKLTDEQKHALVGQKIEVMLETLQQDKGIYVVSRKKYLQSLIPNEIRKVKEEFDKNRDKVYEGIVTGTTPFGVFVEFNKCLTGMIHRYNINEEWATDEKWKSIKPGMPISFYIKDVIVKKNKVILTQIIRESLWDNIWKDKILKGKVIDIKPFGALIQLDEETNGLVQRSYMQKNNISLKIGDEINVKVLLVIKDDRKIYLSVARNTKKKNKQ